MTLSTFLVKKELEKIKVDLLDGLKTNVPSILSAMVMAQGKASMRSVIIAILFPIILQLLTRYIEYLKKKNDQMFSYTIKNYTGIFIHDILPELTEKTIISSGSFNCYSTSYNLEKCSNGVDLRKPIGDSSKDSSLNFASFPADRFNKYNLPIECRKYIDQINNKEFEFIYESYNFEIRSIDKDALMAMGTIINSWNDIILHSFNKNKPVKQYPENIDLSPCVYKNFNQLFVSKENKVIRQLIENWMKDEHEYKRLNIVHKLGFLFYGPPGTGKTTVSNVVANEFGMSLTKMNISKMDEIQLDKFGKDIRKSVVVFDEADLLFDGYLTNESSIEIEVDGKKLAKEIHVNKNARYSKLLEVLDGMYHFHDCIFIFTTNNPDKIPPELKRPGRIDYIMNFQNCVQEQFEEIFNYYVGFPPKHTITDLKYSVAYVMDSVVIPYRKQPEKIYELLK